jgi:hypothetical protein
MAFDTFNVFKPKFSNTDCTSFTQNEAFFAIAYYLINKPKSTCYNAIKARSASMICTKHSIPLWGEACQYKAFTIFLNAIAGS